MTILERCGMCGGVMLEVVYELIVGGFMAADTTTANARVQWRCARCGYAPSRWER